MAAQGLTGLAAAQEPVKYSDAWWEMRAQDPPGAPDRQGRQIVAAVSPPVRPAAALEAQNFHHAHYWPYPYNCMDEAYVRTVTDIQAANGWMTATTLQDYHFFPDTNQLNSAGRQQLFWVLTAPPQYRTVYVAQGVSPEIAQVRLAKAQEMAQQLAPDHTVPIVARAGSVYGPPG